MNVILPDISGQNTVSQNEIEQVQIKEHEYYLLGTFLRTRGLRLFGYNSFDDKVFEVAIKHGDTIHLVPMDGKLIPVDYDMESCTVDSRHTYFESLNMRNAVRRVQNFKQGRIGELSNLVRPNPEGIKFF